MTTKAADRHLAVGDSVEFGFVNGTTEALTVEGIYSEEDLAGAYVVSHALHERTGADQFDFSVYVATAPGVSHAEAKAAIATVSEDYPNAELQSRAEYIEDQAAQVDQIVNLMYGLLGLAIVIALFSVANSVSLSIHERTHELGLVRRGGDDPAPDRKRYPVGGRHRGPARDRARCVARPVPRVGDQRHLAPGRSHQVQHSADISGRDRRCRCDRRRTRSRPARLAGSPSRRHARHRH